MKLTRSLLRPGSFFRRHRASSFFTRRRGATAADNPEPSSPKVTCIGQVRVKSQKRVKQCRRRISGGEVSFRSAEPSFQQQQRRSQRDQRWVHLPSISVLLRAVGHEFCCFFRCRFRCSCLERREREGEQVMRRGGSGSGGELFGRWLVAVHGGGGSRREIEEEEVEEMGNSRRHVFDDIEVIGDRIEVKGERFVNGGVSICIPPKNALLLMRCRSDPLKMAAIANRISSDALRYDNGASDEEEEEDNDDGRRIFVVEVFEQEKKEMDNIVGENGCICSEEKVVEIEQEEEEEEEVEEVESNMSSFEALLEQENTENYQDCSIQQEEREEGNAEESTKSNAEDKAYANNNDNPNPTTTTVEENENQESIAVPLPENQETAAAEVLPECLLLMMREPKLSMEVSKETWVCATDFIRLLPERPRKAANKAAAAAPADQVKRTAAVEKSKPRVPPLPCKKNDIQPARSSCSLPAAAAGKERKRVSGGACEPLALTRCKSEPMSTAAAKLMPEPGCWKENAGMKLEPHRQAALGVGAAEVGV